jgi:tetratricopeptide (TPR) repeat protein
MQSENRLEQLLEFLRNTPGDEFLHYAVALEYQAMGELRKAESLLHEQKLRSPEYLAVYYQLGKLLEQQQREDEALAVYREGLEVAKRQGNQKTAAELQAAIDLL